MNKDFYKTKAGFIHSNIDEFDGKFFGMSPYELEFTE
jgi:acyl transferase domain-containing protein